MAPNGMQHIVFFKIKSGRRKSFFVLVIGAYSSSKSTNVKIQTKVTKKARTLITTKAEGRTNSPYTNL